MKRHRHFRNKVVLITGGSAGIGKEIAAQVLAMDGKVIITGRDAQKLADAEETFRAYSENLLVHHGNVTDEKSNAALLGKIISKFGRLDVLITNAGISSYGAVETLSPSVVKQVIDTNICGVLFPVHAALPELKKTRGVILLVSSVAGFHGFPDYAPYCASKMALIAIAQSLRTELYGSGITISIAHVGFTENENQKKTLSGSGEWITIPERPQRWTSSRMVTAQRMLKQIHRRRKKQIHSLPGKFLDRFIRYFPQLTAWIICRNYQRSKNG